MADALNMIGQSIGNYRIDSLLGKGGMGVVYKAHHTHIRRPAAVKVLNAEMSCNKEVVQRFLNEALAANVIQHPSLVGVFEAGYLANGCAFLIMEYLDGETLYRYLARVGRIPEVPALLIMHQIASALAPLHAQGIVHRDLKADNVMLIADPDLAGGKRVKILDFGLAKVAVQHQMQTVKTRDGISMGTPHYMAPEQWISASQVDGKADVYSLGVLFYSMLTGRLPFRGDSAKDLQHQHLYEDVPQASTDVPEVTLKLSTFVRSMLAKKRSDRPTMKDVLNLVDQQLSFQGVTSAAPRISLVVPTQLPKQADTRDDFATTMAPKGTAAGQTPDFLTTHIQPGTKPSAK